MNISRVRHVLFDWGDTLMSEDGPPDYTMANWPTVRALEGAAEVLGVLSRQYVLSIATNATISKRPDVRRALGRVGLSQFIGEIFCYTDLGSRKDEPVFWEAVMEKLSAAPDEMVMIGDSLEQDVLGPKKVGIEAIWFNWKKEAARAGVSVFAIESLCELLPMFAGER